MHLQEDMGNNDSKTSVPVSKSVAPFASKFTKTRKKNEYDQELNEPPQLEETKIDVEEIVSGDHLFVYSYLLDHLGGMYIKAINAHQ